MKKTISLFGLLLSTLAFAQIKIDNSPNPILIGKIITGSFSIEKLENKYTLCYDDAKFTKISTLKCFSFLDLDNDFENLYNLIMNGFESVPADKVKLDLPNDLIELEYLKTMGVVNLRIWHTNKHTGVIGYTGYITKKQVQKLFGKRK